LFDLRNADSAPGIESHYARQGYVPDMKFFRRVYVLNP